MKTGGSSDKPISELEFDEFDNPVEKLVVPGTPEYQTAFEKVYGKAGTPEDGVVCVDFLGRVIKEGNMSMKRGELESPSENKVLIFKDHALEYPSLFMKVRVLGPPEDTRGFARLFGLADCQMANSLDDADLVVFTGGPDVDPFYYGEVPLEGYHWGDEGRDAADIGAYLHCLDAGIPMTGICRGAQFLAVMNGAKLWQHIDGHNGGHAMWDVKCSQRLMNVSSVHHQAVMQGAEGMELIAIDPRPVDRWTASKKGEPIHSKGSIVEAFFFRETCCIGVQGHPEYADYNRYSQWYLELLDEYININVDLELVGEGDAARRRMKSDLLLQRQSGIKLPKNVK